MMRIQCHGKSTDPNRPGDPCGAPLGQLAGDVVFRTTSSSMPERAEGNWIRCRRCRQWNRFDFVRLEVRA
jgi:hypothetical protein